jgi:CubicO group peptidase (beta-lactamase class C family)
MLTMKPLAITATALALALAGTTTFAQGDAVDELVTRHMQRQRIPGVSLAVVKDGHVVKAAGYGSANLYLPRPSSSPR